MSSSPTIFASAAIDQLPLVRHELVHELSIGQHLVVGAPGSGKTMLLRQLVKHIEVGGVRPEEILVLTPNRAAASKLRDAIALDSRKASSTPRARSLASFAFMQHLAKRPDLKLFSGSQQQAVIEDLIATSPHAPWGLDVLTIRLQGFVQELRDLLTICIEFQLGEDQLAKLAEKYPAKQFEIARELLPRYLQKLDEFGALDSSQLVAASPTKTNAKFVLVDDAQDISRAGLQLIGEISKGKNLVLFGDPDSSVLGFRSGLSEGFLAFFPQNKKHFLTPRSQFDFELGRLSSKLPPLFAGPQRHVGQGEPNIESRLFVNQVAEADWLAAQIRRSRLETGLEFSDIAVVARTRVQLEQIASQLSSRMVPVHIVGAQLALRDQYLARSILELAQLAFELPDSTLIPQVLQSSVVGLDAIGVRRLLRQLVGMTEYQGKTKDQILQEALEIGVEPASFELRKLNRLADLIREVRELADGTAHELVSKVFENIDSKLLQTIAKGRTEPALSANRDLDSALELFAAAIRFDQREGKTAAEFVSLQLSQAVPEDSLAPIGLRDAVQLATASQLIDKRYELVFAPRLQDGIWPNLRPRTSLLGAQSLAAFLDGRVDTPLEPARSELDDEIRLFYKTIGAANQQVYLSAMSSIEEQPSQFFELLHLAPEIQQVAIDFDLRRLVGRYRKQLAQGDLSVAPRLAALALLGVAGAHPDGWQGLLPISTGDSLAGDQDLIRFSPSRLDAFETCPLHWFINNFGGDGSGFEASLGTLLHEALEMARNGQEVVGYLESNWHTLEFETQWQAASQKRKAVKMAAAIGEYLQSADRLLQAEQKFELSIGRLQIVGKIDRVEEAADGTIQVVDLKTGRVPTQAQVDGHRQLAVYQLAMRQLGHEVSGGRIVAVGDQKLKILQQGKLEGEAEAQILNLLQQVIDGAGGSEFNASISSHCQGDENCQLLLTKAVTHG